MYNDTMAKPKTAQATSTPPPHPFAYNPATAVPFAALATSEPLDPVQGLRELMPSEGSGKSQPHPESEVLSRGAGMRTAGPASQQQQKSHFRERESRDSVGMGTFGLGPGPDTNVSQRQGQSHKVSAVRSSSYDLAPLLSIAGRTFVAQAVRGSLSCADEETCAFRWSGSSPSPTAWPTLASRSS